MRTCCRLLGHCGHLGHAKHGWCHLMPYRFSHDDYIILYIHARPGFRKDQELKLAELRSVSFWVIGVIGLCVWTGHFRGGEVRSSEAPRAKTVDAGRYPETMFVFCRWQLAGEMVANSKYSIHYRVYHGHTAMLGWSGTERWVIN